ncbi:MAG TPA: Gfo/Idh/MocA family oxidoreductase [Vicinamibacterales bacterium]|jgi:predicted dehydrogenase|nr:Gfo/Idh/MocA family oxidoreductase [Vicinamibacterales bacterium]
MIGVGIVGYGYWGPNLVRNFAEIAGCRVVGISDLRPDRLALAQARYPAAAVTTNCAELFDDPRVDAVVIATPVSSHYPLALAALRAGKHVLVEKPFTATTEQALRLIDEADRAGRVLAVDHTFVYTPAVQKIREIVASGSLGQIYYYDSVRVNLGLFQHDVNVIWDLAVHDLSIMDYVLPARPVAVSATGLGHVPGKPENIAYLTLLFEENVIGHVHINWLAPVKLRRTLIGGSQKMIVYDDLEPSEKVKIYDKGITVTENGNGDGGKYQLLVGYRAGDMWAPQLDVVEALGIELRHFLACVDRGDRPLSDGLAGLRIVSILEAATASLGARGRLIELDSSRCSA